MKKFAVAITLTKNEFGSVHTSTELYLKTAASENEARGEATTDAMASHPGYSVGIVLALEIEQWWVNNTLAVEQNLPQEDV